VRIVYVPFVKVIRVVVFDDAAACTSGNVNVFARYFRPLAFTIVLSKALPRN